MVEPVKKETVLKEIPSFRTVSVIDVRKEMDTYLFY